DYDRSIRQFIPGYEEMLDVAAEAVASASPGLVLDLGAGTGGLTERILERVPEAVVELWDVDDEMLEQATERLERFGDRALRRQKSYFDPFPGCSAIMASLA
ncbi:MAG: class I SAM-dependent methyltransferase, partial [Akkermansiaceae bacterium]|nr:class I SAM-dependent methyltransferase [Akkermansiaceae bacterium]